MKTSDITDLISGFGKSSMLKDPKVLWAIAGTAVAGVLVTALFSSKETRTKMTVFLKDVIDRAVSLSEEYITYKPTNGHTGVKTSRKMHAN